MNKEEIDEKKALLFSNFFELQTLRIIF